MQRCAKPVGAQLSPSSTNASFLLQKCPQSPPASPNVAPSPLAPNNPYTQHEMVSRPASQAQSHCTLYQSTSPSSPSPYADLHDLIHLPGPLTEDAVLKCLHGRFLANQLHTNVGPILLSVNAYHDVGNPLTLSSTRGVPLAPQLLRVVQDAVRQQAETGYPQAMILSGQLLDDGVPRRVPAVPVPVLY